MCAVESGTIAGGGGGGFYNCSLSAIKLGKRYVYLERSNEIGEEGGALSRKKPVRLSYRLPFYPSASQFRYDQPQILVLGLSSIFNELPFVLLCKQLLQIHTFSSVFTDPVSPPPFPTAETIISYNREPNTRPRR